MGPMPYMNGTPCQHGNYACPLCDAEPQAITVPQPVTDLDRFTDNELCQMHLDAGTRALTHFTNVERLIGFMSRMDASDPEYAKIEQTMRTCQEVGIEAHELVQAIATVIRARRANADD